MKKLVLALILTGCGGEPFSSAMFHDRDAPDAGGDAIQGAGGAPVASGGSGTGGRVVVSTGGVGTGGIPGSGGAQATGGVAETGGVSASGGTPGTGGADVVDACAPVTHDNGVGQTWQDCVPLYVYDEAQAMKACKASNSVICIKSERCGPGVYEVQGFNADRSHLAGEWGYGDFATGYVSPDYNLCSPSDPARQAWN